MLLYYIIYVNALYSLIIRCICVDIYYNIPFFNRGCIINMTTTAIYIKLIRTIHTNNTITLLLYNIHIILLLVVLCTVMYYVVLRTITSIVIS